MTIHRQLGDRSRTLTRQRDRDGREERDEKLRGIAPGLLLKIGKLSDHTPAGNPTLRRHINLLVY